MDYWSLYLIDLYCELLSDLLTLIQHITILLPSFLHTCPSLSTSEKELRFSCQTVMLTCSSSFVYWHSIGFCILLVKWQCRYFVYGNLYFGQKVISLVPIATHLSISWVKLLSKGPYKIFLSLRSSLSAFNSMNSFSNLWKYATLETGKVNFNSGYVFGFSIFVAGL